MNSETALNDKMVKILGIPLLGIAIPNITGLITNKRYAMAELAASYLFFILISLAVWEGNVMFMNLIKKKFEWKYSRYYKVMIALFISNLLYSGLLSALLLSGWKLISRENAEAWASVINTSIVIVIASAFITNIYEIISLNNEREYNISRVEQLNVAKAQAELEALKNQIDPHFIFNSLNTLSFLITKEPHSAKLFNDTLAKVYRYILSNKDKDLVLLKEEIEFISNYFYLLKIRFREAINMEIEINDLSADDFLIPPISLQALVENAIKHNDFSDRNPLKISVSVSSNFIIVKNAIQPKAHVQPSSKTGLINLGNRYQLITKRHVIVENSSNIFSVKLPVLKF
jgi:sensor histidine kinase YesM